MNKITSLNLVFTILLILTVVAYFGCEKKAEESKQTEEGVKSENVSADTSSSVPSESEPVTENKTEIPDIKGTWSGSFDNKATTLTITEQTDSSFSGKINISYRQAINQEVRGSFSPATQEMTMTDQLHSRFQGEYKGRLSKDAENFSGTFALNRDGSKYSFNLNKNKGSQQ